MSGFLKRFFCFHDEWGKKCHISRGYLVRIYTCAKCRKHATHTVKISEDELRIFQRLKTFTE